MNYRKMTLAKILNEGDIDLASNAPIAGFTDGLSRNIIKAVRGYMSKYQKLPTKDSLVSVFNNKMPTEKAGIYENYILSLEHIETAEIKSDELEQGLLDGGIVKAVDNNIEELVLAGEDRDVEKIRELVQLLFQDTQNNQVRVKDAKDAIFDVDGMMSIDSFMPTMQQQGTRMSGVVLVSADSGGGKSIFSAQQALFSYLQGLDLLYLNLELPENEMMARMLSHYYLTPFSDIYNMSLSPDEVKLWNERKQEMFSRDNKFRMANATLDGEVIKQFILNEYATGLDVVVLDYIQLVENVTSIEQWKFIQAFVKELHQLTMKLGIVVILPIQINTVDVKEEEGTIKLTTRGSRELEFTSSLWLHIHQSPAEKEDNVARIFTIKSRHSKKEIYVCETEFGTMRFSDAGITMSGAMGGQSEEATDGN